MGSIHKEGFKWSVGEEVGKLTNKSIFAFLKLYCQLLLKKLILRKFKNVPCNKCREKNKRLGGSLFNT